MPLGFGRNLGLFLLSLIAVSLALAPAGAGAGAAVRYVDPAAPGPDRDGVSWRTAYATIGPAMAEAETGDEVRVAEGYYVEPITLKEGVALRGGYPGGENAGGPRDPRAHASVLLGDGTEPGVFAPIGISSATVLDGFDFQTDAMYAVYCVTASPTISNNVFRQSRTGVNCGADGTPQILNNRFFLCDNGVFAGNTSPLVAGNLFVGNITGVRLANGSGSVVNNTVVWCVSGVSLTNATVLVANNVLALNDTGLRASGGAPDVRYNDAFENGADYEGIADPTGRDGNIRQDPRFRDPDTDDYRLLPDSPCLNAGDNAVVATGPDLDGNPRIQGDRVDMGAYEYTRPTAPEVADALRIAAGLSAATVEDMPRLDLETAPPSHGIIDLLDALRQTRR